MRVSIASALGLLVTSAIAECPKLVRDSQQGALAPGLPKRASPSDGKLGIFYMNRIAPSGAQLWIADTDGSNAIPLMANQSNPFDYHPSWSLDGEWIVFTSERRADGQSDLYRIKPDCTGLETLVETDSVEDSGSLSPDGSKLAYISNTMNYTADVFVKDLPTGARHNVTGSDESVFNSVGPHSFFPSSWSPDGKCLAFSSDVNTEWTGHSNGTGWKHTQSLSIYIRLLYYNMTTEDAYGAHGKSAQQSHIVSQLFSVDEESGRSVTPHTYEASLKVSGRYVRNNGNNIGYVVTAGTNSGINYTASSETHQYLNGSMRNPSWSPNGTKVVYEVYEWVQRSAEMPLFSWDNEWEYRFMDVFPQFNEASKRLDTTEKQLGNASSSVVITDAGYDNLLIVGFGTWFFNRGNYPANLYLFDAEGTKDYEKMTNGSLNAGFPSWSPDGTKVVYRLWDGQNGPLGQHILDLATRESTQLTNGWDNTPGWSPDGELIVLLAVRLKSLVIQGALVTEAKHATPVQDSSVWRPYSMGIVRVRIGEHLKVGSIRPDGADAEAINIPAAPRGPIRLAKIIVMNADGSNKTMLTESMWEDSMPMYVWRSSFEEGA
ncbi:unnamed protein product [Clonostachys chloroleuca]|uniref:Uncharacterized protein n=1 Tax=Clonostachys chloroleuca TaxID=1926264 RepID=A0AA35Q7P5_9HYPO|nr:unnamed protein product [Clonostachys chloroleuca]